MICSTILTEFADCSDNCLKETREEAREQLEGYCNNLIMRCHSLDLVMVTCMLLVSDWGGGMKEKIQESPQNRFGHGY